MSVKYVEFSKYDELYTKAVWLQETRDSCYDARDSCYNARDSCHDGECLKVYNLTS